MFIQVAALLLRGILGLPVEGQEEVRCWGNVGDMLGQWQNRMGTTVIIEVI